MKKVIVFVVFLIALGEAFDLSESFSEYYVLNIAPIFRIPLSAISAIFPFSLFESFFLLLTALIIPFVIALIRRKRVKIYLLGALFTLLFIFSTFILTFAPTYSRKPIDRFEKREMTAENIKTALEGALSELSELEILHRSGAETLPDMTFFEISEELNRSADKASDKYGFLQKYGFRAKPLATSSLLAYTGISGIYGFFTGEANINTAFAPYSIPFTMAHELSHQRGVGREMEAEFSALLICLESDEPYIRYSGYSQAIITLSNLLFEYDEELFYELLLDFPPYLLTDVTLSAAKYEEYSSTPIDEIAGSINDIYLLSNGDEGIKSYSLASELYVAYFLEKAEEK